MGLSIARRFGREGFEILMTARNAGKLKEFYDQLAAEGIQSRYYASDIADIDVFRKQLAAVVSEHPDISVLVYNASSYNPAKPTDINLDVFVKDFHINVTGALLAVQAVLKQMEPRHSGMIFLTGGGTALQAPAVLASLGVGKAGLRNLTFSLADECHSKGIHVATVTICGMIQPQSRFDPDDIAEKYWGIYQQAPDEWETEVMWQ